MKVIEGRNVAENMANGLSWLLSRGTVEESRNGSVLVAPDPVTNVYHEPRERVIYSPARNANPFFHLMESLWMLDGRNDTGWVAQFNARMKEYSDDGITQWGAYGYRWRSFFDTDQLTALAVGLATEPNTRRAVLTMWDGYEDLHQGFHGGRDVPCNTHAYFDRRGGALNMTVLNRSNDAIWGAYGANAVHFSILQEYLSIRLGIPMGVYRQVSNNLHAYLDVYSREALGTIAVECARDRSYADDQATSLPLCVDPQRFDEELHNHFFLNPHGVGAGYSEPFLAQVASPMYFLWTFRRNPTACNALLGGLDPSNDWIMAGTEWLFRFWERNSL